MKSFSVLCSVVISFGLTQTAWAEDTDHTRKTLTNVSGVFVLIEALSPELEELGLWKSTLQTHVEVRLRKAGIRVVDENELKNVTGTPNLYLAIQSVKHPSLEIFSYSVDLELDQDVVLDQDRDTYVNTETWSARGIIAIAGRSRVVEAIRRNVGDLTDQFINAYLSVNPKD